MGLGEGAAQRAGVVGKSAIRIQKLEIYFGGWGLVAIKGNSAVYFYISQHPNLAVGFYLYRATTTHRRNSHLLNYYLYL